MLPVSRLDVNEESSPWVSFAYSVNYFLICYWLMARGQNLLTQMLKSLHLHHQALFAFLPSVQHVQDDSPAPLPDTQSSILIRYVNGHNECNTVSTPGDVQWEVVVWEVCHESGFVGGLPWEVCLCGTFAVRGVLVWEVCRERCACVGGLPWEVCLWALSCCQTLIKEPLLALHAVFSTEARD